MIKQKTNQKPRIPRIPKPLRIPKKRRRLKNIAVLPSLVTLMNGLCGFSAILLASQGADMVWRPPLFPKTNMSYFALAGYMILLGMVADILDGHIARISKTTSGFGAQLDSLCDVISFGVAPAFLMLKLVELHSHHFQIGNYPPAAIFGSVVYLIAIIYVMCAIIRLARFNVENREDDPGHLSFVGLPSPPAAGAIVSMVVFQQDFLPKISNWPPQLINSLELITVRALPAITLIAGLLMITRIPYDHAANRLLRGKKSFSTFLLVFFVVLVMIWNIQLAMVLGFCIYVIYGIVRWLFIVINKSGKKVKTENLNIKT